MATHPTYRKRAVRHSPAARLQRTMGFHPERSTRGDEHPLELDLRTPPTGAVA